MQWVETTGRTVEDAKEAALDQLGIDTSEAEFEILEEPKTGLFGRIRADARIRARVQPKAPRSKQERRPRRNKARSSGVESEGSGDDNTNEAGPDELTAAAVAEGASASQARRGGGRRNASDHGSDSGGPSTTNKQEGDHMTDDLVSVGTQADIVTEFLEGLLDALGAAGSITRTQVDEETIELSVEGDGLGALIGPKGQTLTAVHELSRTVLQRRATGRHEGRVRIDIAGYRRRRQEALARFATQQAEMVAEEGMARALEPMNAADRKVVHDTVNGIDGVATSSEGADPDRRVVISPVTAEV